jgi:RNA polymerase sigma-70 factor, ECF subfamily
MDASDQLSTAALQHLDALYNLARWLVRDPVEAEDLVQETYLRAIRAAHQFRPGTNLRAWLFQILRNTFFTEFKRRAREPVEDPVVLDRLPRPNGPANLDHRLAIAPDGMAGLDLVAALDRLPEEQRTVVLLADVEDCTMEEIAVALDCPVGTVKSRLFRARGTLKGLLGDYVQ